MNPSRAHMLLPCEKICRPQDVITSKHGLNLQLVAQLEKEVEQLVHGLLADLSADPAARVQALFTWITHGVHFDVAAYKRGKTLDARHDAGLCAFHKRKALSSGFADLFHVMCSFAGIECARIQGFLKDLTYIPGDPIHDVINHEWNAVRLNGEWKLVDVMLGSGYRSSNKTFIKRYSPFHLFTDPCEFVHMHWPVNPRWQLLPTPMALTNFEKEAVYYAGFFQYDVISCDQPLAVLYTQDTVSIQLTSYCTLLYDYQLHDMRRRKSLGGCVNYRYDALHTCFTVSLPYGGVFLFTILGKPARSPDLKVPLISHSIVCPEIVVGVDSFLKEYIDHNWGITPYFEQFELIPVNTFATKIICRDGKGNISMGRIHKGNGDFELCGLLLCSGHCKCFIQDGMEVYLEECDRNTYTTDGYVRATVEQAEDQLCSFTKLTLHFVCPHEGCFQLQVLGRLCKDSAFVCLSQHYVINHPSS